MLKPITILVFPPSSQIHVLPLFWLALVTTSSLVLTIFSSLHPIFLVTQWLISLQLFDLETFLIQCLSIFICLLFYTHSLISVSSKFSRFVAINLLIKHITLRLPELRSIRRNAIPTNTHTIFIFSTKSCIIGRKLYQLWHSNRFFSNKSCIEHNIGTSARQIHNIQLFNLNSVKTCIWHYFTKNHPMRCLFFA